MAMSFIRNLFLLLTLLLAGCAASSVQRDFSLNSKPDQGVVIISVSFDQSGSRNFQGTFFMDQGSETLQPLGVQLRALREYPFARLGSEFEDSYGQVLALALPAGKHVINSWRLVRTSLYEIGPRKAPAPLEFQVVAGKVQYLGNLHLNLRSGKNMFGISMIDDARPEVRDQRVRDITMIEKKYPQFKDQISIQLLPQGPWLNDAGTRSNSLPIYIQGATPIVIPAMPISSNKE
jgi:hypothetical protein